MATEVNIFVEGKADERFLQDFIEYHYSSESLGFTITPTHGWEKIKSQNKEGESIRIQMEKNSDNGITNLLIFDADEDYSTRLRDLVEWKNDYGLDVDFFLWPNNSDSGDLEVVLENIIAEQNAPIFECWQSYEACLASKEISGRSNTLTTPARKSKITAYMEALLGESKAQKNLMHPNKRNYLKTEYWNLNHEFLNPLKDCLDRFFLTES